MTGKCSYCARIGQMGNVEQFRSSDPLHPGFLVGNYGSIIGRSGKLITPTCKDRKYLVVVYRVSGANYSVGIHVLVATAFIGTKPEGMEVAHADNNTHNNEWTNLRWTTHRDNMLDKVKHNTVQHGERNGNRKLNDADVEMIRLLAASGQSYPAIARQFSITRQNVGFIVRRQTWTHLS